MCRNNLHGLKWNSDVRLGIVVNAPVFPLLGDRRGATRSVHSFAYQNKNKIRAPKAERALAESQGRFHGRAKPSLSRWLRACNQSFQLFTWKFCVFIYAGGGNLGTTPAGLNIQLRLIMWMYVWRKKIYGSRNYGWHLSKSSGHVGWNRVKFYWVCVRGVGWGGVGCWANGNIVAGGETPAGWWLLEIKRARFVFKRAEVEITHAHGQPSLKICRLIYLAAAEASRANLLKKWASAKITLSVLW